MDIFNSSLNIEFIILCVILVFLLFCEILTIDDTKNKEKTLLRKSNTCQMLEECGVSRCDMKNYILEY